MSPRILALLAAAALGGGIFFLYRSRPADGDAARRGAEERAPADGAPSDASRSAPADSTGSPDEDSRVRPEDAELVGVVGVPGKLLPQRKPTDEEKAAVREWIKLAGGKDSPDALLDDSGRPPGTDPDSLFLKYGSYDVRRLQEEHASLRAILEWQDNGPFEEKSAELLPPILRRTLEFELDYLEQRILYP